MTSTTIDTISVKEKYEASSGKQKTRTTTIKSMDNQGSQFVNIHSGRGSVCISKGMIPKVMKALKEVGWKESKKEDTISKLQKEIAELKKAQKKK